MPLPRGGQLRTGIEQALDDHGHNQIALRTTLGGNHRIQAEFANGQQHGFDVAVGQSLLRGEQILGRNQGLIAQQAAEGVDFLLGPIGEVGQGTFVDFVALAVALAEEDGGRGVAIGDGLDVHGITICIYIRPCQYQTINYMGTFDKTYLGNTLCKSDGCAEIRSNFYGNFGLANFAVTSFDRGINMKMNVIGAMMLGLVASALANAQQQPPPLQLNVSYHCANNIIVVVKHCEKRNGTEFCSLVKGAPNGPLGDEISMPKAQAAAITLMCPAQGSASAGTAQSTTAKVQQASSDYTNDLPSIERVKAEIKGSDLTDALARQVAVFTYLVSYIDRIKYNRTVDGPFTPGEQKMMGAYRLAAYQMSQEYAKTHSPTEAQAFERLHGQYEMNGVFYKDWSTRLIGPQSAAAYKGAEASLSASGQRHYEQEMQQYKQDSAAQQAADKQISGTQGLSNDPTAVATRRCLELGGSSVGCMGKGFKSGLMDLIGFGTEAQEEFTGPGKAGVVLSGVYKNPATVTTLGFGESGVTIGGCGKLVDDSHGYAIDKRPGSVRVTIDNEPNPIVLTMRSDGGLNGPGLIGVKGHIIVGYHTETKTLYRDGVPAAPGTCDGPCSTSVSVPDYAPAIARCVIGSFAMPLPAKAAPANAQPAKESGITSLVTGF